MRFRIFPRDNNSRPPRMLARAAVLLWAVPLASSCRGVAELFLDIPPRQEARLDVAGDPQPTSDATISVLAELQRVAQDTIRPPIEAIVNLDSVLDMLPKDASGNVDWVIARRTGVINPRSSAPRVSHPPALPGFGFDFVLEGVAEMFNAVFPHSAHVELLTCGTCHPTIYPFRNQETTMEEINSGESCGRCHGSIAFPVTACFRCHTAMPVSGAVEPTLYDDIRFTRPDSIVGFAGTSGNETPTAHFPHWVHRIRYKCMACHTSLFNTRVGTDTLMKVDMQNGRSCGACHDGSAAFPLFECNRCHSEEVMSDSLP